MTYFMHQYQRIYHSFSTAEIYCLRFRVTEESVPGIYFFIY